jgi:hypothetical protein
MDQNESQDRELRAALTQLNRIIDEEIRAALRKGPTTVEAVDQKVKTRCSILMEQVGMLLAARERREMIRQKLKKTEVAPKQAAAAMQRMQMEFSGMEEFRGIPPTVTYATKEGIVKYIPYLTTHECERAAALKLLADSIAADQQTYLAMKSGNEFAAKLVNIYGDLPLWELYRHWKTDLEQGAQTA